MIAPDAIEREIDRLCGELLISFEDLSDDAMIPVRAFMCGVARLQYSQITAEDWLLLPKWETVGWFRTQIRDCFAQVAQGWAP